MFSATYKKNVRYILNIFTTLLTRIRYCASFKARHPPVLPGRTQKLLPPLVFSLLSFKGLVGSDLPGLVALKSALMEKSGAVVER